MTPEPFRIGLLGHGTVGSAFAELLDERADAIEAEVGLRPELAGRADAQPGRLRRPARAQRPDRRADGRHRARARLRAARARRPAGTSSPPTSSCSPSTARRSSTRRARGGVQLRFEGAVAGRRAGDPRDGRDARRRAHRARARDRQRHDQLHPHPDGGHRRVVRGGAARGPGDGLRRGRPDRGRDRQGRRRQDGDPGPAGLRRGRAGSTRSATRASSGSPRTTSPTPASWGCRSS